MTVNSNNPCFIFLIYVNPISCVVLTVYVLSVLFNSISITYSSLYSPASKICSSEYTPTIAEIKSHNEFQQSVLGQEKMKDTSVKDVDIRNYAKHILRTRPMHEKRESLGNLRSKLILQEKEILIQETNS